MHVGCNRCTCTIIETIPYLCWQHFIFSIDDCDGTGDHENYFKDITAAYEIDATSYTDCRKTAASYRSKYERGLSKACLCFLIKRRVAIQLSFNSNYLAKKKLSTQSSRELLIPPLFILIFFSLHLFKNYGNSNKCVDMEVTYFLECTFMAQAGRLGTEAICKVNRKQFIKWVYDMDRERKEQRVREH